MNETLLRSRIHHAIDVRLSSLPSEQNVEYAVFKAASKPHKRLKTAFIAALVLAMLLTISAVAAVLLWENHAVQMVQKERQAGSYSQWSAADKAALIEALCALGHIEENEQTAALFSLSAADEEIHQLADSLILSFLEANPNIQTYETAFNHRIDSVTSSMLTFAIMGPHESWPAEKRVWWQKLTNPHVSSSNDMIFANPEPTEMTEAEAIASAKKALMTILGIPQGELNKAQAVADMYVTEERPDYRRWLVTFNILSQGSNQYVEKAYEVFVDCYGNLIADSDYGSELLEAKAARLYPDETACPPILEVYQTFADDEESSLVREWSVEAKAAYSAAIRPQVLTALAERNFSELTSPDALNGAPHGEVIASTQCAYGLPRKDDLPLDDARDLARLYVYNAYGLDEQTNAAQYAYYEYFDVTNPDKPLWKFVFFPESFSGLHTVPVYKVTLLARSGEKESVQRYEWKEIFSGPPYHPVWY